MNRKKFFIIGLLIASTLMIQIYASDNNNNTDSECKSWGWAGPFYTVTQQDIRSKKEFLQEFCDDTTSQTKIKALHADKQTQTDNHAGEIIVTDTQHAINCALEQLNKNLKSFKKQY